jgi:phosphoribosylformimino-5-aminoimidazole carboxamide ribonucleotide (ProFAR) isomerase
MLSTTGLHVVASGGVGDVGDILRLRRLGSPARRLDGVVIGSALWSGRMSLGEARKMSLATAYR